MTIDGPNKRRITLKGNKTFRMIEVKTDGTSSMVISIDGLIIRDGSVEDGDGGGIYTTGSPILNFTNVAILNNTAQRGGGICMELGGTLYLTDSTIAGNTATGDSGAGGISIFQSTVRILNSTVSSNQATSEYDGTGGIRLINPSNWSIIGSTIAFNSSQGKAVASAGGLSALNGNSGPLKNTILAKNTGINPDFYGRGGGSYNLIGISDRFFDGQLGNIVGSADHPIDPQLAQLTDNGGGLPTHALLLGSQAIDGGNNSLSVDQHGLPLIADQRGYARIINSTIDLGAYEFNSQSPISNSTITGQVTNPYGRGLFGAQVRLSDASGETRYAMTNQFGYYKFFNVQTDSLLTIECLYKRNLVSSQIMRIEENVENINFSTSAQSTLNRRVNEMSRPQFESL